MKSNGYQLFITDLDGTLLDDQKNISVENLVAMKKLTEDQIYVTVFTGRNYASAKRFIDELGIHIPVVLQNGAFILDAFSEEVIYRSDLDTSTAIQILQKASSMGMDTLAYTDFLSIHDMLVERRIWTSSPFDPYIQSNRLRIEYVSSIQDKISPLESIAQLAIIGEASVCAKLTEWAKKQLPGKMSPIMSTVMSGEDHSQGIGFLEFYGANVSKAIALEKVLQRFRITPEQTVFIGDNYNDVELMEKVGFAVCVDNSPDDIKKKCHMVVSSNNSHGVAEAIQKIFY